MKSFDKYLLLLNKKETKKDWQIKQLLGDLDKLISENNQVIIAIDGNSGSGKSTLSKVLATIYDANLFHIDDFFKKPIIDQTDPLSKYGSNIDFEKIKSTIINPLLKKEDVSYQPFDFKCHTHLKSITKKYKNINFIEGSFSMHPYLNSYYNYKVFIKVNYFKQISRIFKRSGFRRTIKFITTWIPNENKYHRHLQISQKANFIITG